MRQRHRGRRESTVAAVEEIIPGLDLSLSNRNSYNYCGSIRLKRQKKIFREREELHIIHGSAITQCWPGLEHGDGAQSDTMQRLSPLCMVFKKTASPANILFLLFLIGCHFFQFWSHQIDPQAFKFKCHSKAVSKPTIVTGLYLIWSFSIQFLSINSHYFNIGAGGLMVEQMSSKRQLWSWLPQLGWALIVWYDRFQCCLRCIFWFIQFSSKPTFNILGNI